MKDRELFLEPRILIGIPLSGPWIYWRTVSALLEMEKPGESRLSVFQGALIDRARNRIVEEMLAMKATHLFFLDSDVVPARDTLTRLLHHDLSIVGGVYRRRIPPHEPMAFVKSPSLKKRGMGGDLKPITLSRRSQLQPVDFIGTGCLLIRREVFERVRPPWFRSEWRRSGHLSEDFSFCEKARKKGYRIFADPTVNPLHLEPVGIGSDNKGRARFTPLT